MSTVFETVWADDTSPFLYKSDSLGVGVVADTFPKFPDQVVIIPATGFPDRDNASFSDLSLTTQLALTCLVSVMDRKMRDFSGVPGVRAIARTDGFVVPDHPHIVMFPALRGESDAYTKPSLFTDEAVRKKLVQNTLRNLALTANEKVELDEELNWLEYVGIPS